MAAYYIWCRISYRYNRCLRKLAVWRICIILCKTLLIPLPGMGGIHFACWLPSNKVLYHVSEQAISSALIWAGTLHILWNNTGRDPSLPQGDLPHSNCLSRYYSFLLVMYRNSHRCVITACLLPDFTTCYLSLKPTSVALLAHILQGRNRPLSTALPLACLHRPLITAYLNVQCCW